MQSLRGKAPRLTVYDNNTTMSEFLLIYCLRIHQGLRVESTHSSRLIEANNIVIRLHFLERPQHCTLEARCLTKALGYSLLFART
jgi:hypothetical protein